VYATKDRIRVVVVMAAFRIEGDIHVLSGSRLTDALNSKAKDFFALTEAKVFRIDGDELVAAPSYLAINRESIACIFPMDENA
jgi:hypothetical protein